MRRLILTLTMVVLTLLPAVAVAQGKIETKPGQFPELLSRVSLEDVVAVYYRFTYDGQSFGLLQGMLYEPMRGQLIIIRQTDEVTPAFIELISVMRHLWSAWDSSGLDPNYRGVSLDYGHDDEQRLVRNLSYLPRIYQRYRTLFEIQDVQVWYDGTRDPGLPFHIED